MKLIVVIPDGLCDLRYRELDGLSPVEYASTPGLDQLVKGGQIGLVQTMYDNLPLGSLVGILGILGCNPVRHFPLARSLFEAQALGLSLHPADLVFRCNVVQVSRDDRLLDFTANQIDESSVRDYIAQIDLPLPFELYHDLSYRNVLIQRDCPLAVEAMQLHEPHENMGRLIEEILPRYHTDLFQSLVEIMMASRRDGLMLWPWGAGRLRSLPRFSLSVLAVTGLSFVAGMVGMMGGKAIIPPGATGYLNSDLEAKLKALSQYLPEIELGIIHCNAPDEEAHIRSLQGKVQAIEDIDRRVIRPLLTTLATLDEPWRILICPDHYTCCLDGRHRGGLVPYILAGSAIRPNHGLAAYSEIEISNVNPQVIKSYDLIPGIMTRSIF